MAEEQPTAAPGAAVWNNGLAKKTFQEIFIWLSPPSLSLSRHGNPFSSSVPKQKAIHQNTP